jgi:hypothetical protein
MDVVIKVAIKVNIRVWVDVVLIRRRGNGVIPCVDVGGVRTESS